MKKFVKKIFILIIAPLIGVFLILLGFVAYTDRLLNHYPTDPEITSLFVGDSHIQLAIDDKLLPNSLNIGNTGESIYFSYFKLKMLLNSNPSIKKVYLGLGYHSLSSSYDKHINGDCSSEIAPKYFYLLPYKEKLQMACWNKNKLIPFVRNITRQGFRKNAKDSYSPFMGGFSNQYVNDQEYKPAIDKRLLSHYPHAVDSNSYSEFNIQKLDEIINLCASKNIELYILNTPLHHYYSSGVPKKYKDKLNQIIISKHLNYIDLSDLKFNKDCFILDGDHVSSLGATATSLKLKEMLQKRE